MEGMQKGHREVGKAARKEVEVTYCNSCQRKESHRYGCDDLHGFAVSLHDVAVVLRDEIICLLRQQAYIR